MHVVRLMSIFHVHISPKFPFLHHSWQWIKIHIRSLFQDGWRYMIYLLLVNIFSNSVSAGSPHPATVVNTLGGSRLRLLEVLLPGSKVLAIRRAGRLEKLKGMRRGMCFAKEKTNVVLRWYTYKMTWKCLGESQNHRFGTKLTFKVF